MKQRCKECLNRKEQISYAGSKEGQQRGVPHGFGIPDLGLRFDTEVNSMQRPVFLSYIYAIHYLKNPLDAGNESYKCKTERKRKTRMCLDSSVFSEFKSGLLYNQGDNSVHLGFKSSLVINMTDSRYICYGLSNTGPKA